MSDSCPGTSAAMAALMLLLACEIAAAQGAAPPPAVTVAPVVTREVQESGDFIGRVTAIDKVDIVARVPNPEGLLIPGGVVGVTTERGKPKPALVVPQSAVQLDQAGRYVLLVDQAKKVELRRISTGAERGRDIVVSDGLKEGDLVIVEGIQKVRPGQVVTANLAPSN